MSGTKRVFLEGRASGWELHSLYSELIDFPPEGYEFMVAPNERVSNSQNVIYSLNRRLVRNDVTKVLYDYVRPLAYYFYNRLKNEFRPENVDLTYACQHVVFRREPWVVDLEHAGALVAYGKIKVFKKMVERALRSDYCKRIIPWTEMGRRSLLSSFDYRGFEEKIEVVNLAVRPKRFRKRFDDDKIKLLFVGTANPVNIGDSFAIKGGNEVLKAFESLRKDYRNLELVVRSYVPANIKEKYASFENIRIINSVIPWKVLDYEFRTADIFIFPGHSTPGMAILDAMSYELPVVATEVWANRELVDEGKTGFLVRGNAKVKYSDSRCVPTWGEPWFMQAISVPDPSMIRDLVNKIGTLVQDSSLRRKMGSAGRKEVEEGKFSISRRNIILEKVFDEALE